MNKVGFFGAFLLFVSAAASAIPPPDTVIVRASFTPSVVGYGQSTTFQWSATNGAYCDVDGLPGGWRSGESGAYTFPATESITVFVSCENGMGYGSRSATLTVSNAAPTVSTGFSPSTVYVGGAGSTFSWNSTMASSCSSPQHGGVAGTSGSVQVAPASAPSQQTMTVNCVGANGSASSSSTLSTANAPPPPPIVYVWASPSYLFSPGFVSITYNAVNATSCSGAGTYYASMSTNFTVTCWGPGGYASSFAPVTVAGGMYGYSAPASIAPASAPAPAAKGGKPAVKRIPPALAHLGIDLLKLRYEYTEADFNRDGSLDLMVHDKAKSQAHVLLSKAGRYPSITKTVGNISKLTQIKGVFVPLSGAAGQIRVTVENQQ